MADLRSIRTGVVSIRYLSETLGEFLKGEFNFDKQGVKEILSPYVKALRDDLYVLIEYPYVDKVYRDSFYTYFSSKHTKYERDCVRLSFFNLKFEETDFHSEKAIVKLQDNFLGYIVLRPLERKLIGRSLLSPNALKKTDFSCCIVKTTASVNGIKFHIEGFPHSSQDSETITCAETTLWVVMEYFGHRYAEYKPILPSTIINVLSASSYERQKPSVGLQPSQISYALKEFGFGVKIYSSETYGEEFRKILFHYVQSGIPVIAALTYDSHEVKQEDDSKRIVIGHAVTYIGLGGLDLQVIKKAKVTDTLENGVAPLQIIDSSTFQRDLIAIDDNVPAYQRTNFDKPAGYYSNKMANCRISSIIVPLYHKIYLEAVLAKQLIFSTLTDKTFGLLHQQPLVLNFYLTSSRSYKNERLRNKSIGTLHKQLLMYTNMPKFIWVAEISTKSLFSKNKGIGFILLDATATNQNLDDLLIFVAYPTATYAYDGDELKKFATSLNPFVLYENNLQKF
jgi:hypothetical protein